ncbi:MAG TPA: hypothetical protein VGC54_01830 [Planctomycetota bacterium]
MRALTCWLLLAASLSAQEAQVRLELGLRMRAFEQAWEETSSTAALKRSVMLVEGAASAYLQGNYGAVARQLEDAWFELRSAAAPTAAERYLAALTLRPAAMLADAARERLVVRVDAMHDVPPPESAEDWVLELALGKAGETRRVRLRLDGMLPAELELPLRGLPPGDHELALELRQGGVLRLRRARVVSLAARVDERLDALEEASAALQEDRGATSAVLTLARETALLRGLREGEPYETPVLANARLAAAERLAERLVAGDGGLALGPGDHALVLATASGPAPIRLSLPLVAVAVAGDGAARPVLFALHGAGGSENMFFEGYGAGKLVDLCAERGWILVATRARNFAAPPDVPAILQALAPICAVDSGRVYLLGHSLGAAHALALVSARPELYAGVAAIAGGANFRPDPQLAKTAFFVATGEFDFARRGALALYRSLQEGGFARVRLRDLEGLGHMLVVPELLAEALDWIGGPPPAR